MKKLGMGRIAVGAGAASTVKPAADLREAGRQIAKQYEQAIVNVQIIVSIKMSMGGQSGNENEAKIETCGTVLSPDGLTVVPLSAVDLSQLYRKMTGGGEDETSGMNMDSRVKGIKLIVGKRQEIPATVVLRDNDLNIAFLRPIDKPAQPMTCIDLSQEAQPALLDEVFTLARLGRVADREISAMTGEIQAIIHKPRKFYVPSGELASGGMGVPVFARDGRVVGIVLVRTSPGGPEDALSNMLSIGGAQSGMLVVILPTRDVRDVAAQAPAPTADANDDTAAAPSPAPAKKK